MSDEQPEFLQVFISHEAMVTAFLEWVKNNGWHLQGPVTFHDGDSPTHFLQPMPSQEALHAYLREEMAKEKSQRVALVEDMQRDDS